MPGHLGRRFRSLSPTPAKESPPSICQHIFERFYRADPARDRAHGGSGVGLAIARALIMAHGATITASSGGPGLGARFTITLPASRLPAG